MSTWRSRSARSARLTDIFGPEEEEIEALREAAKVDRDRSMIEHGRRIGGVPGARWRGR